MISILPHPDHQGILSQRLADDPRLSTAQKDAMVETARRDSRAGVVGLDAKMRPVLRARVSGPGKTTTWSLMRNGDPADPVLPMKETWR